MKLIAIDIEGTIANIYSPWIEKYRLPFTIDAIHDWDFTCLKKYGVVLSQFLEQTAKIWQSDPFFIRPFESNIDEIINDFQSFHFVTNRNELAGIKIWLDHYNINYQTLVYTKKQKDLLPYDIYIDDNPDLAMRISAYSNKILYLIDRPWNRYVSDSCFWNITRVYSMKMAINLCRCVVR